MKATHKCYTSFCELFPPPHFLEMPSVGLDISDKTIRFVELKRRGLHLHLGAYGEENIPEGIVEDGFVKDKPRLIEALTAFKRKHNLHFVKASLPEGESYLFKTTIPMMKEADIRPALRFKIEENVPVTLKNAVYDYKILKQPAPGDTQLYVSVTVIHMKVVSGYTESFKGAGLVPLALEVESQAVARAVTPREATGAYIVITIRETRTIFSIVSGGEVQYMSTVHVGGKSITDSMEKSLNINEGEVEKIRQGKEFRDSNEMFLSLVSAATVLRDEIQKLITYWENYDPEYTKKQRIEGIILSGSDAMLGIDDYLSRPLDMKVSIANPWVNIMSTQDEVPALTLREALDYAPALGLALPYD